MDFMCLAEAPWPSSGVGGEAEEERRSRSTAREKIPLEYELDNEDDFVQPAIQPAAQSEPEPEGGGRRTRCPMLVTATQALGSDGSAGGGTSLLPIAVFLESRHVSAQAHTEALTTATTT